jgi:predicted site-specific integrase-resolvase
MEPQIDLSQLPNVPVMSRERFAELAGLEVGVVNGWINKGYLPVVEFGRYRLVNLALLTKMALEKEFSL